MLISKVKAVRVIHLTGETEYQDETYQLSRTIGVIELTGSRQEGRGATLKVGFTDEVPTPGPTFVADEHEAVGTITLPGIQFAAYLALAQTPAAHFRIGDPAEQNALGLEATILR
ncbi:MAG: hypothetical protein EOO32_00265 [Comamonadaceae bacterium]|nr:MAG: hypothetical protein EOO32_00265 [Comamonadaceae bacterium]